MNIWINTPPSPQLTFSRRAGCIGKRKWIVKFYLNWKCLSFPVFILFCGITKSFAYLVPRVAEVYFRIHRSRFTVHCVYLHPAKCRPVRNVGDEKVSSTLAIHYTITSKRSYLTVFKMNLAIHDIAFKKGIRGSVHYFSLAVAKL